MMAAGDFFNYFASGSDGSVVGFVAGTISADQQTVTLSLEPSTPFVQGVSYTLEACCICDVSFNCMPQPQTIPITFPASPPIVISATATYGGPTLTVGFNEPVDPLMATDVFNYAAIGSDGIPVGWDSATLSADQRTVTLFLDAFSTFVQGVSYTLEVCCVCDTALNCMPQPQTVAITFQTVPVSLVARGSVWRYLDTAVDPGPFWFDPFYDDSLWAFGPAELGYGDNDEATVINNTDPNTGLRLITAYFRHTFNVTDVSAIPGLSLQLWRDDGAIVYINGTEVFRNNMPGGPATYSTLASALAVDDGEMGLSANLVSSVLVNGANVIAVEVHQQSPSSSDLSFDLELLVGNAPPPNDPPIANNQSVIVPFNTPTPITLTGFDPNGDPVIFSIVTSPAHGTVTGTPPNVTYTPNSGFTGSDSFTFKVNDGQLDSAVATVSLDVQPGQNSLIPQGSVWRYLDTGIDPGTAWVNLAFDDFSWAAGPAELGFGDGDEATVISSTNVFGRLITAYFRHTFNVANPSQISGLSLRLWRDDGAVVYLNGVEVFRNNMPSGPVSYSTLALAAAPDDGNTAVLAQFSAGLLVSGINVMAVEVHQNSPVSSDITFDLQLDPSETPENRPPTANSQSVTTFQNTPVAITLTGSDPDGDPLSFTVTSLPAHGSLSGTPPDLTYTPAPDFLGTDAFTFTVSDAEFESTNALVRIQVNPPPNPPDIVAAVAECNGLQVAVAFDEPVDPASSQDVFNYFITDSNGEPVFILNAVLVDPQTVILSVDPPLVPGQSYILEAFGICDTSGDCFFQPQTVPIQFETIPPTVACSVAVNTLLPANNHLVDVGLSASASEGTLQVQVFSDEPEVASLQDAVLTGGTLQLRARKSPSSDGRVYLIVVTAADACGNVGVCCTTVVVPATGSQASLDAVNAQAAAALAPCSPTGAPSTPHQILP